MDTDEVRGAVKLLHDVVKFYERETSRTEGKTALDALRILESALATALERATKKAVEHLKSEQRPGSTEINRILRRIARRLAGTAECTCIGIMSMQGCDVHDQRNLTLEEERALTVNEETN